MKIKRFVAKDIRLAMRMVKEELGANAVIMSNRSVDEGVEIVAAKDFDEQSFHNQLNRQGNSAGKPGGNEKKMELASFETAKNKVHLISSPRKKGVDGSIPRKPAHRDIDQYVGYAEKIHLATEQNRQATSHQSKFKQSSSSRDKRLIKTDQQDSQEPSAINNDFIMEMRKEIKSLRSVLDTRLSEMSWSQGVKNNPIRLDMLRRLAEMGFSKKLAIKIANRMNSQNNAAEAFQKVKEMLIKVLPIANDNLLEYGGIVALVGPTGVGKTTTIAKLAAEYILKHGSRQVAIITTDNYRIGAYEQILTYGRLLDVPVRVAANAEELQSHVNSFSDKSLILIDTAGMSQRNMCLAEQIQTLKQSNLSIKTYLVMSAATHYQAVNEIINAFKVFQAEYVILTKLDEAVEKGSTLSAIIEHQIPLAFMTNGQQVPEDICIPDAYTLIEQCVAELDKESSVNKDLGFDEWVADGYA
nr:flagellar biosynthesis protein FlhF [Rhodospirillales bacterium]